MKILYISQPSEDYLSDTIFHGLHDLGEDVTDAHYMRHMWAGALTPEQKFRLYGNGFTVFGTVPTDGKHIDRTDTPLKVRAKYFDLIVYGNCHRCLDLWDEVSSVYPPNKVVFLDGEDGPGTKPLAHLGVYFKRELDDPNPAYHPISFSIPECKLTGDPLECPKTKLLAQIIPYDNSTYGFTSELEYYRDYAQSCFGITRKKGGWDCMRHYEILASGCVPLFLGLENCPPRTLTTLSKDELLNAKRELLRVLKIQEDEVVSALRGASPNYINDQLAEMHYISRAICLNLHAQVSLTTKAAAKRMIDTVLSH